MALNIAVFRTRAITAVLFAVIMLLGLFVNQWTFTILVVVIHFGSWYEFSRLLKNIYGKSTWRLLPGGLLYITMPMLMLANLAFVPFDMRVTGKQFFPLIPAGIIFSIWINDTMAYIVGSLAGKTPFSKISPKKTWEGTAGGALLCVLAIGLCAPMAYSRLSLPPGVLITPAHWYFIAAICAIAGTVGDLFESKLKRLAGVKDSGTFMPGHGGFLDRFDSLLIATPFVWLYACFFAR